MIAGNTLAGLTLVFLGATANRYESYEADEQSSVRDQFRLRIWLAFSGFSAALLAALCALANKWIDSQFIIIASVVFLFVSFVSLFIVALFTARSIR